MKNESKVVASTDWLGRITIFYNDRSFSTNINDLINPDFEWDAEGLFHYLNWGMSVFYHTPIKGVFFLPPNNDLVRDEQGRLKPQPRAEPNWLRILNTPTHPDDVLHKIETCIRNFEENTRDDIIVPLSGGYDSRLIAIMIKEKDRIRAYTYGLGKNQSESCEAVYAQEIARRLKISWKRIELGDFNKYIPIGIGDMECRLMRTECIISSSTKKLERKRLAHYCRVWWVMRGLESQSPLLIITTTWTN